MTFLSSSQHHESTECTETNQAHSTLIIISVVQQTVCAYLYCDLTTVILFHLIMHLSLTHSSIMETVTRVFDARLANRPFLVFDEPAQWRSGLNARVPESQKLKMVGYPTWRRIPELV